MFKVIKIENPKNIEEKIIKVLSDINFKICTMN